MDNKLSNKLIISTIITVILLLLVIVFTAGCKPDTGSTGDYIWIEKPFEQTAISLLDLTPEELSDIEITTSRLSFNNKSIDGWYNPSGSSLSFEVTIDENAHLSVLLGIIGTITAEHVDTRLNISFLRDGADVPETIMDTLLSDFSGSENQFLFNDSPIELESGSGKLIFGVDNLQSGQDQLEIFWGAPTIYYPEKKNHRNVLLIGIDTLRLDSVSMYGDNPDITPHMTQFTQNAAIFNRCWAQSSWTLPSFASMITGGMPSDIGATITTGYLPDAALTIGEILHEKGFATKTVCSNTWLGNDQSGFHQGMDELWYVYGAGATESVSAAQDFIERSKNRDWFCFLHFFDPHSPYSPPEEFRTRLVDPAYEGEWKEIFGRNEELMAGTLVPQGDDLEHIHNLFDGEVAHIDKALDSLFSYLDSEGLLDETLIIFAADHGEEFYDHGEFDHGHTHYEEMVHMPLWVKGHGFPAVRSDASVGNTDIVPTILDWLEFDIPDALAGVPLQSILAGETPPDRIIFGEGNNRGADRKFAIDWPYKAIRNFVTGETRLYNLEIDPDENHDIHSLEPEVTERLSNLMTATMLPDSTSIHAWFIRGGDAFDSRLSGTIELSVQVANIQAFGLSNSDFFSYDGSTITFDVVNSLPVSGIDKHLAIFPESDDVQIDVELLVNFQTRDDFLYPYGTLDVEPESRASVHISEFPLGPDFGTGDITLPPGLYIWGVQGFDPEELREHFDSQTWDEIRSLGYIN